MPEWKKNIFVRVIRRRAKEEGKAAEELLAEYPALTEDERLEIVESI